MPSLVTLKQMRSRYAVPDEDSVNLQMSESLNATSSIVERWLETDFGEQTGAIDQFELPNGMSTVNKKYPVLRLDYGFVTAMTTVLASGLREDLANGDVVDQAKFTKLDSDRGLLSVDMMFPVGSLALARVYRIPTAWFFQATYDSGFTVSAVTGQGDVYQAVPNWLQELAMLTGKAVYDNSGVCDEEKLSKGTLGAQIRTLLAKKQRNVPYGLRPIFPRR